jgi:hypothetical protein
MIAIGIAILFISWVLDCLWDADTFPENYSTVYGWATLIGAVLVVAGVVVLAWRYLP